MPLIMHRKRNPITFPAALAAARIIGVDALDEVPTADAAAAIAAVALKTQNADPEDPSIDWESLIEFIERMLPLILKIIDLFS